MDGDNWKVAKSRMKYYWIPMTTSLMICGKGKREKG